MQNKYACKQPSGASIFTKFRTLVALPKAYLSIKFGTIPTKIERDISDSRSKCFTFFVTPIWKTVGAIVLKFLSASCQCLKVCLFDLFVNRSSIADFMITKTSRCDF